MNSKAVLALFLAATSSAATADEVTVVEACSYFMPALTAEAVNGGQPHFEFPSFEVIGVGLERYARLTTQEFLVEYKADVVGGDPRLFGLVSARATCLADTKLKRVLSIQLLPGASVGETTTYPSNSSRETTIRPIDAKTVMVGEQVHEGRY